MKDHISVCICTYKRPHLLENNLTALLSERSSDYFDCSIVVVDNDSDCSAREAVEAIANGSRIDIEYFSEPRQNIALARNKAVGCAKGDFIAFIDDDERPGEKWLENLYAAIKKYSTDGILGPVQPEFETQPPGWVLRGGLFQRPLHRTGEIIDWKDTRTGNILIKKKVFIEHPDWFRPELGSGGEDRDFFKRKIEQGYKFVWCNEAVVFEYIPAERWKTAVQIKRALLRGKMAYIGSSFKLTGTFASVAAGLAYGISLPFLLVISPLVGYEFFFKYLVACFDHLGKLLSVFKIDVIKEKYITT